MRCVGGVKMLSASLMRRRRREFLWSVMIYMYTRLYNTHV